MVRWVSATIASAPWSLSRLTVVRAVSRTASNLTSGPVLDKWCVSGVMMPKKPMVRSPTLRVCVGTSPANGWPSPVRTLVPNHANFDSATRCLRTAVPKSNSWLPTTAMSRPTAFISSII